MTDILEKTRAVLLVVLMLGSVVALSTPVVATNASTTTVDDPGGDAPVPGDTQDVLNLTVNSGDKLITPASGSATDNPGDSTGLFESGTATSPEMFVNDGTSAGYQNEDDVLHLTRNRNGGGKTDSGGDGLNGKVIHDFASTTVYTNLNTAGYDDNEAIVDDSTGSVSGILDDNDTVRHSGDAAYVRIPDTVVYIDDGGDGSYTGDRDYDPAVPSSYTGDIVYDEGSTGGLSGETGERRISPVVVRGALGDDSDPATLDLTSISKFVKLASDDPDAGQSSTEFSNTPHILTADTGNNGWDPGDTDHDAVVLDVDASGNVNSGDVLLFDEGVFGFQSGEKFDSSVTPEGMIDQTTHDSTSAALGFDDAAAKDNTVYDSGDNVFIDVEGDRATADDLQLSGGSTVTSPNDGGTSGQAFNAGGEFRYWDSDSPEGHTALDGVYADIAAKGDLTSGDVRLTGWQTAYAADSTVSSGDADEKSITDSETATFATSLRLIDSTNTGYGVVDAPLDEPIVDTEGTNDNLSDSDTVLTAGTAGFTSFTSDTRMFVDDNEKSAVYDSDDDILSVNRVSQASNSTALDGKTINDFNSTVGYLDTLNTGTNAYDDGEAIYSEGDTGAVGGDDFGDDVTAITVVNNGTLSNDHIDEVTLYQNGSQIASTTSTTSNGSWVFSGLGADVHSGAHSDFLLRATIASDAPADETLNFSVVPASDDGDNTFQSGDSGLFFEQAAVTGDYSNGADITVDSPSAISVDGISFNDSSDNNRTKVELAFSRSINDTTATPGHFTVYREDGQTVSISDVETGASADDGQLGIDLGSANSARIHTVNISTNSVSTTEGANISAQNVSVTATTKTITEGTAVSTNTAYQDEYVAIYADSNGNLDENITIDSDTTGDGTYDTSVFGGSTGTGSQIYAFDTQSQNPDHDFRTTFQSADGDSDETATLGLQRLGLNASAQNTAITDDGDLQLDVSTNLSDRDLKGELVAENGETVTTQTATLDDSGQGTLNFGTREAGNYTVEVTDVQTGSSVTSNEITVTTPQAAFSANTVTVDSGDSGKISINLQSADTATVTVGSKATGYLANVTVKDGDGDSAIRLEWDTHLAGETSGVSDDFSVADSDDEITQTEIDSAAQPDDSVDTGTYDLAVRTGTDPSVKSQSSAAIVVEGRSGGGSSTGTELTAETSTKDPNTTPAQDRTGGLTGAQTGRSSGGPTSEPIENRTATPTTTEAPATIEQPADDATSTEQETPGFGVIVAVLALLAVVRLAGRRHS
jgi:PGF-CTERM protein